jgi:hypothetical protein
MYKCENELKMENSCPTEVIQAGTIENEHENVNVRMCKWQAADS